MAGNMQKMSKSGPVLLRRLQKHLKTDPAVLPVLGHQFPNHERPNLHLALEKILAADGRQADLIGVLATSENFEPGLGRLSRAASAQHFELGPVEYADVLLPGGRQLSCVKSGLYLVQEKEGPLAVMLSTSMRFMPQPFIQVEVMAGQREQAEQFLREVQRLADHGQAYRGHVLSLQTDCFGNITIRNHALPAIRRDELILPEGLLQRIERHTLSFSKHAERLRTAGRHLKRGILLHGPPGTGKTLTAMYLVAQMPGRTVLMMTGAGLRTLEPACRLAKLLEPATVVLEDVDLIGSQRDTQEVGANSLLFELLNQMDGLGEDSDVLFILTTNRPDVLEPALAARPGRVDQALEIPPPDAECRRRLFELYSRGLRVEVANWKKLIERTAGVTASFIRELLRKAAVYAAEEEADGALVVSDRHLDEGLAELLVAGGPLTKSLLGGGGGKETVG